MPLSSPVLPLHHAPSRSVLRRADGAMAVAAAPETLRMRQLRHHTKNALQAMIAQIDQVPALQDTEAGRRLARELQNRILLSAKVSDALFGFTEAPPALEARLRSLCESLVRLFGRPGQDIGAEVTVLGSCPAGLHEAILRSVHEMVVNAVRHGLQARTEGCIRVRLETVGPATSLCVQDNGQGFERTPPDDGGDEDGQGLEIIRELIAEHAGRLRLQREADATIVTIEFPRGSSAALFR